MVSLVACHRHLCGCTVWGHRSVAVTPPKITGCQPGTIFKLHDQSRARSGSGRAVGDRGANVEYFSYLVRNSLPHSRKWSDSHCESHRSTSDTYMHLLPHNNGGTESMGLEITTPCQSCTAAVLLQEPLSVSSDNKFIKITITT